MLTGRLFQSRGAAAMKDRSPMITFVKRLGCSEEFPCYFAVIHNGMAVKQKLSDKIFRRWTLEYFKGDQKDFKLDM